MYRLLLACLVALTMTAAARSEPLAVRLVPGEALDHAVADRLLAGPVAAAVGAEGARIAIRKPALPLANPYREDAVLRVTSLTLLPQDRFAAQLQIDVGHGAPLHLDLTGEFVRLVAVATPARPLAAGASISADDLTVQLLAEDRLRTDWITDASRLVGQEVLRALPAGRPIPLESVGAPRLVHRGEPVRLLYQRGGLRLEAQGTAEADGGAGAMVMARNQASGVSVRGRVVGRRTLVVEDVR